MNKENNMIQVFENKEVRSKWDSEKEEWFFSVEDVVSVLTESVDPKQYIKKMRNRDKELSSNWGTICTQVKMIAKDGKKRNIQAADMEGIFRIIQSIPSPKAEPFKLWLAKVGKERIDETIDPELAIQRAKETYLKKGYDEKWIQQRMISIKARNELTDQWKSHGIKEGIEYALLTDALTLEWSGLKTKDYKNLKNIKKGNLRDNMSTLELTLNQLAEATTTELTKTYNPQGFDENEKITRQGGKIAGDARKAIEEKTGKSVVTSKNALDFTKNNLELD
ncbi:Bro-N domain-containing protein [Peptoniphilus gorbachii]|uniref:Prophage antirepressor-like protein n=1 Tax=Peptoniphilus gorbachii TaxID=411567 RepID=A0ABS2MKL0_9FIRM|nr:Bro-N domain-containing protein [Peptoniphilus gorbachii]MBM7550553.1 prophage antirepressor-like protein [Peptoniphilus gorbachii]MDU1583401.1 Bro-N domain-containing protein [Peptoniphilus harei]MDU1664272.1 Bro-N domain-containing protein [Peptoniphilus harei]